ncbi:MAG: flavodoxin family protein [Methanobrevibacter sp.]|nr:flavodoxin family protein [Methanobrevibacter sp.]
MKTIVINASPRKRLNTAQIMKSACEGAESVGADVEYIDLKGCMSCLICKNKKT